MTIQSVLATLLGWKSRSSSESEEPTGEDSDGFEADQSPMAVFSVSHIHHDQTVKNVSFVQMADVYFITSRKDMSQKQKRRLWYTRKEFFTMVTRNIQQIQEEMEMAEQIEGSAAPFFP